MDAPKTDIADSPVYKAYTSSINVEKEIKASYVSHFNNRVILSDQAKDTLHERFLLVLEENPQYIDAILYLGKYQATTHLPANCTHKPETCDNCRDGDTDFYMDDKSTCVLTSLWKETHEFMGDEENSDEDRNGDNDGENQSEASNEEDKSDDYKEIQKDIPVEQAVHIVTTVPDNSSDDDSDE